VPNGVINSDMLTGVFGAFVAKLNANGDKFLYSGRISGGARGCTGGSSCFVSPRFTWGVAIALDAKVRPISHDEVHPRQRGYIAERFGGA
jgi:hypothetical protein